MRVSERFVLANQATQLLSQILHPLLNLRIFVGLGFFSPDRDRA
jgi:hypothetical protein